MKAKLFSFFLKQKWNQLKANQANPSAAQQRAYEKLQNKLRGTRISELRNLDSISNFENFVAQTPVSTYKDMAEMIEEQLTHPQEKVLFNDRVAFIGLSSGTTAATAKKIPFSESVLKSFESFQISFGAILQEHFQLNLLSDRRLTWGSSAEIEKSPEGVPCGYVSGFLSQRSPRMIRSKSFPSQETVGILDMKEKVRRAGEEIRGQDLRLLSGVPTYLIHLLEELRSEWNVKNFAEIWPNLNTIVYSATSIEPFKEQLTELIGRPVQFVGCYIATEGPVGYEIPSLNGGKNGLYSFHFGDFVYGFRILNGRDGAIVPVGKLKAGDEVEVLISSPSGLLNYSMGDVLRIVSVDPIVSFEIMGRLGQGLNVATEKVSMSELQAAALNASKQMGQPIRHFFVHPGRAANGRACYEWTILVDEPGQVDVNVAASAVDQALMSLNEDYKENRLDTLFLGSPVIKVMSSDVQKVYFARDAHRGQLKMKTCFESKEKYTEFLSALLPDLSENSVAV